MLTVLRNTWPLLLGVMLLMVGNGMQGTLLGIRGGIEGFSTFEMSLVMSGYYVGFLFGSQLIPILIRRVGHVRVFAAIGSMIAAVLILYAAIPHWLVWSLMRIVIGFCFSGVYITAESWLNASSDNATRGQALSAYMIAQMIGIIASQAMMNVADPAGYLLFVIPSVLVSLAFTPILLSAGPTPAFGEVKRLNFRKLYEVSPLGVVAMFLLGGVFSALFGMAAVWGTGAGLSVSQVSIFVGAIYVGGLVAQYPIGWASDRMDRRRITCVVAAVGAVAMLVAFVFHPSFILLTVLAAISGSVANPLYSLLIAYTNDYLDKTDMAAASAGLLFVNGVGAMLGPVITGWLMEAFGPWAFFLYLFVMFGGICGYAVWRIVRHPNRSGDYPSAFAVLPAASSVVAVNEALDAAGDTANNETGGPAAGR